jgi:hypothetical protein
MRPVNSGVNSIVSTELVALEWLQSPGALRLAAEVTHFWHRLLRPTLEYQLFSILMRQQWLLSSRTIYISCHILRNTVLNLVFPPSRAKYLKDTSYVRGVQSMPTLPCLERVSSMKRIGFSRTCTNSPPDSHQSLTLLLRRILNQILI